MSREVSQRANIRLIGGTSPLVERAIFSTSRRARPSPQSHSPPSFLAVALAIGLCSFPGLKDYFLTPPHVSSSTVSCDLIIVYY